MEDNNEEKFSEDPIENLRIENELLRLKLDAQYGESFKMETDGQLPPEIENMFLNQVLNFEEQMKNQNEIRLQDKLGIEDQPLSENLSDKEITDRLKNIESVMKDNNLFLDRIYGPYPDKEIYDFITLELFERKTAAASVFTNSIKLDLPKDGESLKNGEDSEDFFTNIQNAEETEQEGAEQDEESEEYDEESEDFDEDEIPDQLQNINGWHFIYEEFRPNHLEEIKAIANQLLGNYHNRETASFDYRLGSEIITASKYAIPRKAAIEKLQAFFDSFTSFEDFEYGIGDTQFQEEGKFMIGHCMGDMKFTAVMENGDTILFEESFGFYLDYDGAVWEVFSMVLPGFSS